MPLSNLIVRAPNARNKVATWLTHSMSIIEARRWDVAIEEHSRAHDNVILSEQVFWQVLNTLAKPDDLAFLVPS